MTQVVNSLGNVVDLAPLENSDDPLQRAIAQTILNMNGWAKSRGYASYDIPPGRDDLVNEYNAQWLVFMDIARKQLGMPTNAQLVAQQALLTSGDARQEADGTWVISDAVAADLASGYGRRYGVGANADEVNSAAQAIIANARNPEGAPVSVLAPPDAGGPSPFMPEATIAPAPLTGFTTTAAPNEPSPATPNGQLAPSPAVLATAGIPDISLTIGDEKRMRTLLLYAGAGALVLYLWQRR